MTNRVVVNGQLATRAASTLQDDGQSSTWKIGLINQHGKYLTAETFGFTINAAGTSLRRKQLWTVEHDQVDDDTVYLRSHLGRYLAGDRKGNVTCCSEECGVAEKFLIQYHVDGSGRWAICSRMTGYYLGGTDDKLLCYEKQPGPSEWWTVHLAVHPQVNLRNVGRQKYARLDIQSDQLQVTELIPWGDEAIIELEFRDSRYCIKACDGRYLDREGALVPHPTADTMFTVEMRSAGQLSGIALRDVTGRYLTAVGRDAVIQPRNRTAGKDEIFVAEHSQPQIFFTAHSGRMISTRQGVNLTAIYLQDDELTDKETFQVEFEKTTDQWRLRTADDTYWILVESGNGIQTNGDARSSMGLFSVDWLSDGSVALCAANGRYVTARMNGSLNAVADSVTSDRERFHITIINRAQLVLRCEYGFVGFRSDAHPRIECNKTTYDVISVEHSGGENAEYMYFLKGNNGKYVTVDAVDGSLNAVSTQPQQPFIIELRGHCKLALRAANGCYVRGEQNGTVSATAVEPVKTALWEY